MKEIKMIHLVYFSGTGGTARVAESFERVFTDRKIEVCKTELNKSDYYIERNADMLVLFFPVYAFNAPKPVDDWIARSPEGNSSPAAVISVSGGGEVRPNIACRYDVIKQLEGKGYDVYYESMLVMPSNIFIAYDDTLSTMLLRALPHKAEMIVSDLLSGKRNRTQPHFIDRFISKLGVLEKKYGGKVFRKMLKANDNCISCSWCAEHCPRGNITMLDGRPCFGGNCIVCLRCVYGCPKKAILSRIKFIVIKDGYDLKAVESRTNQQTKILPVSKVVKGFLYAGVRKYLKDEKIEGLK